MRLLFLPENHVLPLARLLAARYRFWGPAAKGGAFVFEEIADVSRLRLDYSTTLLPPKQAFLPPREILARIDIETHECRSPARPGKPIALFGVHPCDLHGLAHLDLAMGEPPADAPYWRARKDAFIVGLACVQRCMPESFCDSVESHRAGGPFDWMFTPVAGGYVVELRGEAGEREASESGLFEVAGESWKKNYDETRDRIEKTFSGRRLNLASLSSDLERSFQDGWWEKLADRCFSCGACTAVCPTCVCFDVQDEIAEGCRMAERCRSWDSCLIRNFAEVAGGENFRKLRSERLRHRMMRQGAYLAGRFGLPVFCVGCGRCPHACLGKISPLEAFEHSRKFPIRRYAQRLVEHIKNGVTRHE